MKKYLTVERLRNGPRGRRGPLAADEQPGERLRRNYNAKDVLAALEFIERRAADPTDVQFPAESFEELKTTLAELPSSPGSVERMGKLLDRMQFLVTDGEGRRDMVAEPTSCASHEFLDRHAASERKVAKVYGGQRSHLRR